MAEQEDEILEQPEESVAEKAEAIVPKHAQRGSIYVVEKEFTHKRKQSVGSIFRPRHYPRLRPLKLRELIAGGYIRVATPEEARAQANKLVEVSNRIASAAAPQAESAPEVEVSVEPSMEHTGGGWYDVVGPDGVVQRVRGEENAEALLAELTGGD